MDAGEQRWDNTVVRDSFSVDGEPDTISATLRKVLVDEGWEVEVAEDGHSLRAARSTNRAAQLQPADEGARRMLGVWSLRDAYPRGVARGGCVLSTFTFTVEVTITEAYVQTRVDIECAESITAYKGAFPDPTRFWVRSELPAFDPIPTLRAALGVSPVGSS